MQESLSQAFQEFQEVWPSLVCAVVFLLLLLWDVFIALKRRAHWAPAQALVLTALTIQMLSSIAAMSDISYVGSRDERNHEVADLVKKHQLLFDCGRLMMCVFIGYLLPSMVRSNWTQAWSNIGGLILTILFRLAFEVYFVWSIPDRRQSLWFVVSNTTLFTASSVLSLLLSCAVLAGKSIRFILSGKVKWALSCCTHSNSTSTSTPPSPGECKNSCCSDSGGPCKNWCCSENTDRCENTEDHVLKCWIVARVSQPEYIMARSVFSSLAGVIVTISVVTMAVKWACIQLPVRYGIAHKLTVFIEMAFILVGWMVISFRWLTAVLYFPRSPEFLQKMDDFWTQSIVELQADLDARSKSHLYKEKTLKKITVRLHSVLLRLRILLQILMVSLRKACWVLMVSLSKACWGLSQKSMGMIRPFIMITQNRLSWKQKFQKTLNFIQMPGETADDLWRANEMAFRRTQCKIEEGITKGKDNEKLIQLIHEKQSPVDKYFKLKKEDEIYFNKMSLKKRGASLMYCMVHLYEHSNNFEGINGATRDNIKLAVEMAYKMALVIDVAMEACSEAWDLLDFLDSSDNVGADREFDTLRNMWQINFGNLENLKVSIQELADRHTENRERSAQPAGATGEREKWHGSLENWHRSLDWLNLTVQCESYKKLYKKFHSSKMNAQVDDNTHEENMKDLDNLKRILASVIRDCLEKELDKVLIEKCNNWADEGKEEDIHNAAFIAGKAKGLTKSFKVTENPLFSYG